MPSTCFGFRAPTIAPVTARFRNVQAIATSPGDFPCRAPMARSRSTSARFFESFGSWNSGFPLRTQLLWQRVEESPRRPFQLGTTEGLPQFNFSAFQNLLLSLRQIFPSAIDVEVQHRHCRLIWRAFAPFAPFCRTFQRQRNTMRVIPFKDVRLKIERVTALCYFSRPSACFR